MKGHMRVRRFLASIATCQCFLTSKHESMDKVPVSNARTTNGAYNINKPRHWGRLVNCGDGGGAQFIVLVPSKQPCSSICMLRFLDSSSIKVIYSIDLRITCVAVQHTRSSLYMITAPHYMCRRAFNNEWTTTRLTAPLGTMKASIVWFSVWTKLSARSIPPSCRLSS